MKNNEAIDEQSANVMPTPSSHRTQLGPFAESTSRSNSARYRHITNNDSRPALHHTPLQRQPLNSVTAATVNKNGLGSYGMSAGVKVGRQQSK